MRNLVKYCLRLIYPSMLWPISQTSGTFNSTLRSRSLLSLYICFLFSMVLRLCVLRTDELKPTVYVRASPLPPPLRRHQAFIQLQSRVSPRLPNPSPFAPSWQLRALIGSLCAEVAGTGPLMLWKNKAICPRYLKFISNFCWPNLYPNV